MFIFSATHKSCLQLLWYDIVICQLVNIKNIVSQLCMKVKACSTKGHRASLVLISCHTRLVHLSLSNKKKTWGENLFIAHELIAIQFCFQLENQRIELDHKNEKSRNKKLNNSITGYGKYFHISHIYTFRIWKLIFFFGSLKLQMIYDFVHYSGMAFASRWNFPSVFSHFY